LRGSACRPHGGDEAPAPVRLRGVFHLHVQIRTTIGIPQYLITLTKRQQANSDPVQKTCLVRLLSYQAVKHRRRTRHYWLIMIAALVAS
jgi:hypothetical protein